MDLIVTWVFRADRFENNWNIEVCALFQMPVLLLLYSAYPGRWQWQKKGGGFLRFVKADVETCIKRDPKGLYQKALNGEIQNFTGISAPYEEPGNPELVLDTQCNPLDVCVQQLVGKILEMSAFEK